MTVIRIRGTVKVCLKYDSMLFFSGFALRRRYHWIVSSYFRFMVCIFCKAGEVRKIGICFAAQAYIRKDGTGAGGLSIGLSGGLFARLCRQRTASLHTLYGKSCRYTIIAAEDEVMQGT